MLGTSSHSCWIWWYLEHVELGSVGNPDPGAWGLRRLLLPSLEAVELDEQREKLVMSAECQLVTVVAVVSGLLEITTQNVYFYDGSAERVETEEGTSWCSPLLGMAGKGKVWRQGSR